MSTIASPELIASEFAPVHLHSFPAGKPPMVDLYHFAHGRYLLYCGAYAVFTREAQLRLLENDVKELYIRLRAGAVDAGGSSLSELLVLPDTQLTPLAKAGLLYNSAISTAQAALTEPTTPENVEAVQRLVGATVTHLTRDPGALLTLVHMMRHDFSLYTHAVNVCTYATALGRTIRLEQEELLDLSPAAFLHDVGKVRIPPAVLHKPAPLTEEEWAIVRRHPEWGVQILRVKTFSRPLIRTIVLQHHERLDGSGYPQGLTGLHIHLLARLVALVDVYDALTSERPYRASLTPFKALYTIKEEVPGQLDHNLFVSLVKTLGYDN